MTNDRKAARIAIVLPVGPGKESALDTLDSVAAYCPEPHVVYVVDDHTEDGTYEALLAAKKTNWEIFRNAKRHGIDRLTHGLAFAYQQVIRRTSCELILRLDQDALLIKSGVLSDAWEFAEKNPTVGLFGVYSVDYNRPRDFENHRNLIDREMEWVRYFKRRSPSWRRFLRIAERNGYKRGDNVFGGAYFLTRNCLLGMSRIGALDIPWEWNSEMMEDVYFSMVAVAAGFRMGHFAAPDGPLCMEWRGLPYPAGTLAAAKYKLVHSVDKGPNTSAQENGGRTAREVFQQIRKAA